MRTLSIQRKTAPKPILALGLRVSGLNPFGDAVTGIIDRSLDGAGCYRVIVDSARYRLDYVQAHTVEMEQAA